MNYHLFLEILKMITPDAAVETVAAVMVAEMAVDTVEAGMAAVETEVAGFADAKGGKLEIATLIQRITHPDRGLLVEARRDLIHRLDQGAA